MLCALVGAFVVPLSLLLVDGKKKKFSIVKALHFLDFRKKTKNFRIFLILFFVMGLSMGFRGGFVFPLFLSENGFEAEIISVLLGLQLLLAGLSQHVLVRKASFHNLRKVILINGILYTFIFILLGFSSPNLASVLVVAYGITEGLLSISQEGILSKIVAENSYGTDISLLWMGCHIGETLSLAISGLLISIWGFLASFLLTALTFIIFCLPAYYILKE